MDDAIRQDISPATPSMPARRSPIFGALRSRVFALFVIDLVFILGVAAFRPAFASAANFNVIIENMALKSVMMAAMVLLLAAGRFDLSVDGVASLTAIIAGKLMLDLKLDPMLAVPAALAVGMGVGLINGVAIEKLGMNPLMTTLATWWACGGASLGLTGGLSPFGFPKAFDTIGQANLLGVRIIVWYAAVAIIGMAAVLSFTRFGYHTLATGGNRQAARLHGVNVDRVGILLYVLVGGVAAFVGIVFASRIGAASPVAVDGMALEVIAAGVIGGAALSGGEGSVVGGLFGLLLLNMLSNAAIYVGISPYWQKSISGIVLLLAVVADGMSKRGLESTNQRTMLGRLFRVKSK